jgi:hypothetical protein
MVRKATSARQADPFHMTSATLPPTWHVTSRHLLQTLGSSRIVAKSSLFISAGRVADEALHATYHDKFSMGLWQYCHIVREHIGAPISSKPEKVTLRPEVDTIA